MVQRRLIVFILLFASFSLIYSSIAYYTLSRPPAQEFMAWGVFSASGSLSNYFSGSEANVPAGKSLSWHFAVTNRMGSIQYVQVVYRLGNNTSISPNATVSGEAVPQLGNSSIFIPNAQTALVNFTWSITSRTSRGGLILLNMTINGKQVSTSVGAVGGQKIRFFFELWAFDVASDLFQYGDKGANYRVGVSLTVWVNSV